VNHIQERTNSLIADARSRLSVLGSKLNEITGYDAIEELKKSVIQRGMSLLNNSLICTRSQKKKRKKKAAQ
jgi:hypothetical protein